MFLFAAVVLNANKWIYFKWRINFLADQMEFAKAMNLDQDGGKLMIGKVDMQAKIRKLNIVSIVVIVVYMIVNLFFMVY